MKPLAIAGLLAVVAVIPARAGLYSPDEPFNFEIGADGYAKPIQFAGGFESIISGTREIARLPRPGDRPNSYRQVYLDRVAKRQKKGVAALSQEELAGYTADLIRLNRAGEALNILQPLARDPRRGGFLAYAHLAVGHASTGAWPEAFDQQQMAIRYSEFPTAFAKLSKPELAWLKRIERDYYLPFLANRAEESRQKRRFDLNQNVDPLFPPPDRTKKSTDPFKVAREGMDYKAGSIAASERKKLPPDATAIVQQLVLWHPYDSRLYWLLGELYNADGDVEAALKILDHCSFNMGYSNPVLLRHKQILQQAMPAIASQKAAEAEKARQEAEQARQEAEKARAAEAAAKQRDDDNRRKSVEAERDYRKRFWWILSIGVAIVVLLIYYQCRELIRRVRRNFQRA